MATVTQSSPRLSRNQREPSRTGRYLPDGKLNVAGRWSSPGPKYMLPSCIGATNHDLTREKKPAYTIGNKWPDISKNPNSPGPIYNPDPKVLITGKSQPHGAFLASRPKEYTLWHTPGPGSYAPQKHADPAKSSAPAYTIGSKHKHLEIPTHPVGPNQYNLPNTIGNRNVSTKVKTAPAFTLSSRTKFMSITYGMDETPTKLYNPNVDSVKTTSPRFTMAGKNYPPSMDSRIPGPGTYFSENVRYHLPGAPQITMGIRHSELCSTGLPAHQNVVDE